MAKLIVLVFSILIGFDAGAHCSSDSFDSWGILENNYSPGREAFYSSHNYVEPTVYAYSDAIFQKIRQMIVAAERHVYLQTWTFNPKTKPALYLADAIRKLHQRRLRERKSKTVHIWLMLNIVVLQNEETQRKNLQDYIKNQGLDLPGIKIHIGFFKAKLLGANHVKTVSVDNEVAFITGANFSSKNNAKGYFDLGFVVRGEVINHIDYDFVQTWMTRISRKHYPKRWLQSNLVHSRWCQPILTTRSWASPNFTDVVRVNSMNDAFIESIKHASETIDIITPNLNVTPLMSALATAANRGVRVRIILSKGFTDFAQDIPTRGGNNFATVRRMHQALEPYLGRQVCDRLQIKWYGLDGVAAVDSPNPPASHAKFMIVDDEIIYFGSANMDNQSWVNSRELALFVEDHDLATKWRRRIYESVFERSVSVDQCQEL